MVSDVYLLQETRFVVLRGMYFLQGTRDVVLYAMYLLQETRGVALLSMYFLQEIRVVVLLAMYFFTGDPWCRVGNKYYEYELVTIRWCQCFVRYIFYRRPAVSCCLRPIFTRDPRRRGACDVFFYRRPTVSFRKVVL